MWIRTDKNHLINLDSGLSIFPVEKGWHGATRAKLMLQDRHQREFAIEIMDCSAQCMGAVEMIGFLEDWLNIVPGARKTVYSLCLGQEV